MKYVLLFKKLIWLYNHYIILKFKKVNSVERLEHQYHVTRQAQLCVYCITNRFCAKL